MAYPREDWPINECLGVLVGVLGVDWLIDGKAQIFPALAATLATGIVIICWRLWRHKNRDDAP